MNIIPDSKQLIDHLIKTQKQTPNDLLVSLKHELEAYKDGEKPKVDFSTDPIATVEEDIKHLLTYYIN